MTNPPTPVFTIDGAEQITQNPLTVKSTFSIPAKALLLHCSQEILTGVCGLGWTFGVETHPLVPPPVPNGILQPVIAAARNRGRLTIVDSSNQNAMTASNSDSNATNLTVRAHFDSSIVGHLKVRHISCTVRAPGPEGITRSCDTVLANLAEAVVVGTFNYDYPAGQIFEVGGDEEEATFVFTFLVEMMGNSVSDNNTIPQQVERRATTGLAESIRTGCIVDTKFYLYSRKGVHGGASHPKEIYASSAILRGFSADLDILFASNGFKGSEAVPLDLFELKAEDIETEVYDYPGEDSDLESEPQFTPRPPRSPPPSKRRGGRRGGFRSSATSSTRTSALASEASVPSASDHSRLVGSEFPEPTKNPVRQPEDVPLCDPILPTSIPGPKEGEGGGGDEAKPTNEDLSVALTHVQTMTHKNFMRMGRVIIIKDTAFATWEALIRYIYFNEIHFSSLGARAPVQGQCSPKSMYRLADKFGIKTLKDLALENIKSQLSNQNVTAEAFSKFSSLYHEILDVEIEYLLKNYVDANIQTGISKMLQTVVMGEHAYRLDALQRITSGLSAQIQNLTQPKLQAQIRCNYCGRTNYY